MAGGVHGRVGVHSRIDGHCSGRHASYWNAFLLGIWNEFLRLFKKKEQFNR